MKFLEMVEALQEEKNHHKSQYFHKTLEKIPKKYIIDTY